MCYLYTSRPSLLFSVALHCIAEIRSYWVETKLLRSTTLDIITTLLGNTAFVCVHVVGRFSKDFLEVRGLSSRGFQLQCEWMTTVLYANYEKKSKRVHVSRKFNSLFILYISTAKPISLVRGYIEVKISKHDIW